ncbi:MAG: hypothetical protein R3211_04420 [Balneolaceae bacterium]|nr:hypothetical protein [Balneolaceae bacterium]
MRSTVEFHSLLLITALLMVGSCTANDRSTSRVIHTVSGSVDADQLGFTLSHEHLFSNFGKPMEEAGSYDEQAVYRQAIPYLRKLREMGIQTIFDYTAQKFGRRPVMLKVIADSTDMRIVTNTGIYGAAEDRYVPEYAYRVTAEELAKRWTEEFEKGIGESGIRPGFIKLAFDEGAPSAIDKKLFRAGLLTHRTTGLTVAVHTGSNPEAVQVQLQMLEEAGVSPEAWIWAHANWHGETELLLETAAKGAWISLDGVTKDNINRYVDLIRRFRGKGLMDRLLLSHDGDLWPAGEAIRPMEAIPKHLVPALKENGFTREEIDRLLQENPGRAYGVRVREVDG